VRPGCPEVVVNVLSMLGGLRGQFVPCQVILGHASPTHPRSALACLGHSAPRSYALSLWLSSLCYEEITFLILIFYMSCASVSIFVQNCSQNRLSDSQKCTGPDPNHLPPPTMSGSAPSIMGYSILTLYGLTSRTIQPERPRAWQISP